MALDKEKVLSGPYNFVLYEDDGAGGDQEVFSITGLKRDSVSISTEPKEITEELEDGSEEIFDGGDKVTIECTFSQVDVTDFDSIQNTTVKKAEITFTAKGKKIVVDSPTKVTTSIDNLKTKIRVVKSIPLEKKISDMISVTSV